MENSMFPDECMLCSTSHAAHHKDITTSQKQSIILAHRSACMPSVQSRLLLGVVCAKDTVELITRRSPINPH